MTDSGTPPLVQGSGQAAAQTKWQLPPTTSTSSNASSAPAASSSTASGSSSSTKMPGTTSAQNTSVGNMSYYAPAANWSTWNASYPYAGHGYSYYQNPAQYNAGKSVYKPPERKPQVTKPPEPSAPPPPPPFNKHWNDAIRAFFVKLGFTQTIRGLELDLLVMNSEWEEREMPPALDNLYKDLETLRKSSSIGLGSSSLEDRKMEHLTVPEPGTASSMTKSISSFLAKSRVRNDATNRAEFVHSLEEQRQRLSDTNRDATCARADAKTLDRDTQMRYDIAKNEDGPLKRTMKRKNEDDQPDPKGKQKAKVKEEGLTPNGIHFGLDQRMSDMEKHLAVRYVPGIPGDFMDRLKRLEDHIISLEKEYPPWAALHFDQPGRTWPPPPKPTPIIVPRHLVRSSLTESKDMNNTTTPQTSSIAPTSTTKVVGGQKMRNTTSSLSKAVLERYQVHQALADR